MKTLLNKALTKCQDAEVYMRKEQSLSAMFSQGVVKSIDGFSTTNIALRANIDGRIGSAVSTALEDDSIVDRAIASSKYKKQETLTFRNEVPASVKCFDPAVAALTSEDVKREGDRILSLFDKHSDGKITPLISIDVLQRHVHVMNSEGFDNSYDKTEYNLFVGTLSPNGFLEVGHSIAGSQFSQVSEADVLDILHRHSISENRTSLATGKYPVVFSGKAMGALMTRLLGGVSGGNLVKNISPLKGKIGETVASSILTVRDNGLHPFGKDSCPFDDEGHPSQDTLLVDQGVLRSYLVAGSHVEKLGMPPTGNGFKKTMFSQDIEDQPAVCATNFIVEGPSVPDEDLFNGIEKGIYIDGVMGTHTGNIPGGEYSLNISQAYLIENGKLTGKVTGTMVAGNIYDDFKKITALGTTLDPMQVVFYPMGYSPAVRFENLSIVGN